jgi:hypothetical protein
MQEYHRKLIEEQAEAWVENAPKSPLIHIRKANIYETPGGGRLVELDECVPELAARRKTTIHFLPYEVPLMPLPLTAAMIRARFANPFGGK